MPVNVFKQDSHSLLLEPGINQLLLLLLLLSRFSRVQLCMTPWTAAYQAPLSMGFSKQEYWSGLPFPSPGDLPDSGIEPRSPALQADTLLFEPPGKPSPLNLKPLHGKHHCHGKEACVTQWSHEPSCAGPPKLNMSWWRALTKHDSLEKKMETHSSILA